MRTQRRELILGRSLSEFMRSLWINSDRGGARGEQTRLRNQMNRLFSAASQSCNTSRAMAETVGHRDA